MIADIDERASQLAEMTYQLHSVGAHGTHRIVCGVVCHLREYAVVNTVGLAAHEREERDALEPIGSLEPQHFAQRGEYVYMRHHRIGRAAPYRRVTYEHGDAGTGIAQRTFHVGEGYPMVGRK